MDTSNPLTSETIGSQTLADPENIADTKRGLLAAVHEPPAVLGARIGACIFSSFVFPAVLWVAGAVSPAVACAISAALTLIVSRSLLLIGGPRVAHVALIQVAVAALLLPRVITPWIALPTAIFFPLVGMLCTVTLVARLAELALAESASPYEAEAAVALAMQSNVVDIRSAEAARRASKKSRSQSTGSAVTPSLQSQI